MMPSENQIIVELIPTTVGGALGERDEKKTKASFVGCPTFEGDYSIDDKVRLVYVQQALKASEVDGYGFSSFNTDYLANGAPDLSACVDPGADNSGGPQLGKALTPNDEETKNWPIPNPASAVDATWTLQPKPDYNNDADKPKQRNINYGGGPVGPQSPSDTSGIIARQLPWTLSPGSST
jgi:hypothetical protein